MTTIRNQEDRIHLNPGQYNRRLFKLLVDTLFSLVILAPIAKITWVLLLQLLHSNRNALSDAYQGEKN